MFQGHMNKQGPSQMFKTMIFQKHVCKQDPLNVIMSYPRAQKMHRNTNMSNPFVKTRSFTIVETLIFQNSVYRKGPYHMLEH